MGEWRVQWIARRTLGARVERDGSIDGRPLYRVNNLRVVLANDGRSFHRVATCSSCGRLRTTRRTVTAGELHAGKSFELCAECVPATPGPMDLGHVGQVISNDDDDNWSSAPGIE